MAQFRAAWGTDWIVEWHPATGTPSAIYGPGLPIAGWGENSLAAARVHAMQLLNDQHDLLGLGASDFRESIGARMGQTWSFQFDQYFKQLPCIGGRADVRIHMVGAVSLFGSRAWPIPANFDVAPALTDDVATAIAWAKLGEAPTGVRQPARVPRPRLVIWGDIDAPALTPVFLAWEVAISNVDANGNGPMGRYYVDAKTGDVRGYTNDKHGAEDSGAAPAAGPVAVAVPAAPAPEVAALPVMGPPAPPIPTTVTLMAWTRTQPDGMSALVNTALDGVQLNVPGVGIVTTNAAGQFTIDIAAPVTINVGALDGRHHAPIAGPNGPTGAFVVNPGVPTTIQLSTSAATQDQAAHTAVTYWIDNVNEYCRGILGNTPQMAAIDSIAPNVNVASTCNANYGGNTLNFFMQGGGCSNTAFSTVIAHEWGHGLDDQYGGISNTNSDGLSEGWGDIVGMYLVDSPILGSGFTTAGVGIRNGMNNTMYSVVTTDPHLAGEVWMGFAWRLRENLRAALGTPTAKSITEQIVIGSIVANATNRVDAVRQVFIADDNDANLLNGTPHYAQLSAAAIAKGIPYPQVQLVTVAHTPLGSSSQAVTPRAVNATVVATTGSLSQVRLHFNAGAGNVIRFMHPSGAPNGFTALLPGVNSGTVSYHLEIVHSTAAVVRVPASGEYAYVVNPTLQTFFLANFDSGSVGWTSAQVATQNDWQVGDPFGKSGVSNGVAWADPTDAASPPNCFGNDLGNTIGTQAWNGSYMPNVDNYLRSPFINCTGKTGVRLRFKRWLTVEAGQFDQAKVSVNGTVVWQNPAVGNTIDTSWQIVEYVLPMADNNPSVQIEWRLTSDGGVNLGGWNIDDVELLSTIPLTTDCQLRMLPEQAVQGSAMTLTVNTGANSRPFLLILGDNIGPTIVPGFPIVFVGGALTLISGSTNAAGVSTSGFTAPTVPSTVGMSVYSQVLTLDSTFASFVTSNPFLNLFTDTP